MFPFDYFVSCIEWFRSIVTRLKRLCFKPRNILLTEKDLIDYEVLTFLTMEQIRRAYELFESLGAQFSEDDKNPSVDTATILNTPELRVNPFRDRIISIFAASDDFMTFDEYLYMISVFSVDAPMNVKAFYAFKIYDFNGDSYISGEDISEMITRLRGMNPLKSWVYEELTERILEEGDIYGDGFINYSEFEHKMSKNPAFSASFNMRI